jgi:hypothetical protein
MTDPGYDYDAEQAELEQQAADLLAARAQVQAQTRGLEGDIGGFRAEQKLGWDAAHTASVELATAQGGDFYSPDVGQTVAPDGTVTYDFQGHIKAQGLDFDAAAGAILGPSTIDWNRQSDGAMVAYVNGFDSGTQETLQIGAVTPSQADRTQAGARFTVIPPGTAQSWATAVDAAGVVSDRLLVDSLGQSNFPQLPAIQRVIVDGPFVYTATVAPQAVSTSPTFSLVNAVVGGGMIVPFGAITVAAADPPQLAFSWTVQFAVDSQHFTVTLFNGAAAGTPSRKVTWQGMVIHS